MFDMLRWVKYYIRLYCKKVLFALKEVKRTIRLGCSAERKPTTLQLPITYLCNYDCVMCGMRKMIGKHDFSASELKQILSDELFTEINAVGINGGEPFMKKDFVECVNVIVEQLPKLKELYIITNGYFSERIKQCLTLIKPICKERNVKINLSLSIDGINDMQDFHRGHKGAFDKMLATINILKSNDLVDHLGVVTTITRYNIARISEVEVWCQENNLEVNYNIASEIVRLSNSEKVNDFSLLHDEHARMMAREFFYHLFMETKNEKYYALYLYLKEGVRYAPCPYQTIQWVTLTPDTQIAYCATSSKNLGSCLECSALELVKNNEDYLKELCKDKCHNCAHYIQYLSASGLHEMHKEILRNEFMRGNNEW